MGRCTQILRVLAQIFVCTAIKGKNANEDVYMDVLIGFRCLLNIPDSLLN